MSHRFLSFINSVSHRRSHWEYFDIISLNYVHFSENIPTSSQSVKSSTFDYAFTFHSINRKIEKVDKILEMKPYCQC